MLLLSVDRILIKFKCDSGVTSNRNISNLFSLLSCSLQKGGIPVKFVLIDDGWQCVATDPNAVEYKADNTAKSVKRCEFHF